MDAHWYRPVGGHARMADSATRFSTVDNATRRDSVTSRSDIRYLYHGANYASQYHVTEPLL